MSERDNTDRRSVVGKVSKLALPQPSSGDEQSYGIGHGKPICQPLACLVDLVDAR